MKRSKSNGVKPGSNLTDSPILIGAVLLLIMFSIFFSDNGITGAPIARSRGVRAAFNVCGNGICSAGETCNQDSCCNGVSKNFLIDNNNCGGCGVVCGGGTTCQNGQCKSNALNCVTSVNTCKAGELSVITLMDTTDSHVALGNDYQYHVCCSVPGSTLTNTCGTVIARLSGVNDAHIQSTAAFPYIGGVNVCMTASTGIPVCNIANSCQANEACLLSMNDPNDGHAGDCNAYPNKLCCKIQ